MVIRGLPQNLISDCSRFRSDWRQARGHAFCSGEPFMDRTGRRGGADPWSHADREAG